MSEMMKIQKKQNEKGNVLFLILIAVALFAALSYAVTSSSRSGGGNANDETSLVKSAQITQYPSAVRTSIIRMMVSRGIDATELEFNAPSDFSDCTGASDPTPSYTYCVFHPEGGGASLATMSTDVMAGSAAGRWYFSANYEIQDIGTSEATDPAGNDIIAFLPGISNGVCARINEELGVTGDTTSATDWDVTPDAQQMTDGYSIPNETDVIGDADTAGLAGQAFGCLTDSAAENIYYHVLIER
jgi:hypothetical protein